MMARFSCPGGCLLWEVGQLKIGESDVETMEFPGLSLQEAIEYFTASDPLRWPRHPLTRINPGTSCA
jgi:hypothetical protein